jgi:predicted Fe-S protein YdhL (DUF1289 family)
METPCIHVCVLDEPSGYCTGCGRTGDEIGSWTSYDDSQRRALMNALPQRLSALEKSQDDRSQEQKQMKEISAG